MSELPAPEFSRVLRLDQAVNNAAGGTIRAEEEERSALARRFDLLALDRLDADYALAQEEGGLFARGRVRARLAQRCVATGEAVPERIDAPFVIRFLRQEEAPGTDEIELGEEDCDIIFFTGDSVDMGEAVAQTLALALDPYPRSPDADAYLRRMGVLSEEQASPFAALLALKGKDKDD